MLQQAIDTMPRQNRIGDLLERQGWSIYKLAKAVGMPYHNIKRLVDAKQIPDRTAYKTLLNVSSALGVKIDDLETEAKEPPSR